MQKMETEPCQDIILSYSYDEKKQLSLEPSKSDDSVKNISFNLILKNLTSIETDFPFNILNINRLNLTGCNLSKLPRSFGKLQLKELNLSHNCFSSVPDCFYNGLQLLEVLDFSYNQLSTFDLPPDCLHSLKIFKLNNNNAENVPKWILAFSATNLLEFDYSFNRAKNYKYYVEHNINLEVTKLEKLILINSCLIDEDFPFLKKIKSLQYLDISSELDNRKKRSPTLNKFTDLDVLFVKPKWAELYTLKINNLSLSLFPEGIMWHESLREIYVNNNCISWLPDGFEFLVNLEVLEISNNELIALPLKLVNLEYLTVLKAADNKIGSHPDFSKFKYLKVLDLYSNYIDAFDVIFQQTEHVEYFDLEQNFLETNSNDFYKEKRKKLREKYNFDTRIDGCRIVNDVPDSPCISESEPLNSSDNESTPNVETVNVEEEENWDELYDNLSHNLQFNKINLNYGVSVSDEEWQGEEMNFFNYFSNTTRRSYIDVDEKLFCDAD